MNRMDTPARRNRVVFANLALDQGQAIVVAVLASMFTIAVSWIRRGMVGDIIT
jgi:hypothetical protein